MPLHPLGQPCRNFQILGGGTFIDPRDRRQKVVLSTFAAGGTGNLVLVDPLTGAGEDIPLPGDSGAWAVLNWRDEKLLIGTCGTYGYLHCLDLASRAWSDPLRDPDEQYIWNLAVGSDGLVYGGIPGHILVSCGTAEPHLALWNMESGETRRFGPAGAAVREVGDGFICVQTGSETTFYDSCTPEPLERDLSNRLSTGGPPGRYPGSGPPVELADGARLATRGHEYYVEDGSSSTPELRPIPAERPATHILTLIADEAGRLWGAGGFGQTIFQIAASPSDAPQSRALPSAATARR